MKIETLEIILLSVSILGYLVLVGWLFYDAGYKIGQVDAMNGKQKYRLIEFEDGTREYVKNPKQEDYTEPIKIIK